MSESKVETRQALQKEVTVTMTTGRYAKNEVIIRYTGLDAEAKVGIEEIKQMLVELEAANPSPSVSRRIVRDGKESGRNGTGSC